MHQKSFQASLDYKKLLSMRQKISLFAARQVSPETQKNELTDF